MMPVTTNARKPKSSPARSGSGKRAAKEGQRGVGKDRQPQQDGHLGEAEDGDIGAFEQQGGVEHPDSAGQRDGYRQRHSDRDELGEQEREPRSRLGQDKGGRAALLLRRHDAHRQ